MFREVRVTIKPLTDALVKEFRAYPQTDGDRTAKDKRIEFLTSKVENQFFHAPVWAVATCNGITYRVNGNSTSTMFSSGVQIPKGLKVIWREFECDTKEDLADLFAQFDARESARSEAEIVASHGRLHKNLKDCSDADMKNAVAGIAAALTECGATGKTDAVTRAHLTHEYTGFIAWACPYVKVRRMRRTGIIAAMFATYNHSRDRAMEFWAHVEKEDERPGSPTRRLANFLRESITGRDLSGHVLRWDTRAFYAKCVHAWNAWRSGRETDLKYYPNAPLPRAA